MPKRETIRKVVYRCRNCGWTNVREGKKPNRCPMCGGPTITLGKM